MALVHQILDFVDDTDRSLFKLASESAPKHLLGKNVLTAEEREMLDPSQFALVMHSKEAQVLKKFPITDDVNTWLSSRYFEKTAEQLPFVAQKIAATHLKRACSFYGIKPPEAVVKLASSEISGNTYHEVKSFKEDREYDRSVRTVEVTPDGSEHFYALDRRYPMPDASFVKKASEYFKNHYREFIDSEDRATYARNVLARAGELGCEIEKEASTLLGTYGGNSYGDMLPAQIRVRQSLLEDKPELSQALSKLASHKDATAPETFARALHLFDKRASLTKYYDNYLSDPYKSTFGMSKKATGYRWEDSTSGASIDGNVLVKVAQEKYEEIKSHFGTTLAESLQKHPEQIFESLPTDAKLVIVKIAQGVR